MIQTLGVSLVLALGMETRLHAHMEWLECQIKKRGVVLRGFQQKVSNNV